MAGPATNVQHSLAGDGTQGGDHWASDLVGNRGQMLIITRGSRGPTVQLRISKRACHPTLLVVPYLAEPTMSGYRPEHIGSGPSRRRAGARSPTIAVDRGDRACSLATLIHFGSCQLA